MATGIKAIKISRLDNEGTDNSVSLQDLNSLRIDLGDNTITQFNVIGRAEYDNYYLLYVEPLDFESIVISEFNNANSIDDGTILTAGNTKYVEVGSFGSATTTNTGRIKSFTTENLISGSNDNPDGQFTPTIPEAISITIDYNLQQVNPTFFDDDRWRIYLTGSFGKVTSNYINSSEYVFEQGPGQWSPFRQILTYTPTSINESVGIGFEIGQSQNNLQLALSGSGFLTPGSKALEITYRQADIIQSGTTITSVDADTLRGGISTQINANNSLVISDWNVSNPYISDQEFYTPPLNNFYNLGITSSLNFQYDNNGGAGNPTASLELWSTSSLGDILIASTSSIVPSNVGSYEEFTITASYTPAYEDKLYVKVSNTNSNSQYFTIWSGSWDINQTIPSQGENNLTVLQPFVLTEFPNSDYNAIINNTEDDRIYNFYQDVDYSTNLNTPVNYQSILDNTARRARVQQSNYTTAGWINARYNGSKNTSPDVNASGSSTFTPSITQESTFFAYFEAITGSNFELLDKTNATLKYLIDSSGNIQVADNSGSYYNNLVNLFNPLSPANVVFRTEEGTTDTLQGLNSVIRAGEKPRAIIFTQTGSDGTDILPLLTFNGGVDTSILDYRLQGNINFGDLSSTTLRIKNPYNLPIISATSASIVPPFPDALSVTIGTSPTYDSSINIEVSTIDNTIQFQLIIPMFWRVSQGTTRPNNASITYNIFVEKSVNGVDYNTVETIVGSIEGNHGPGNGSYQTNIEALTQRILPVADDKYRFKIRFEVIAEGIYDLTNSSTGTITAQQALNPDQFIDPTLTLWETGSSQYLTGSILQDQNFEKVYGMIQDDVPNAGYETPYLPFEIKPFDEIRFNAIEENSYQIIEVYPPGYFINGGLVLNTDLGVGTGVNMTISTYNNVPLIGGTSGIGAKATIVVSNATTIASCTVTTVGSSYISGESITIEDGKLGLGSNTLGITNPLTDIKITNRGVASPLTLKLDRPIVEGTTVNNFLIRRYNTNANNVILDIASTNANGTGFLLPEHPTSDLLVNFDTIIKNLTEKGIL